jgi:hypothetical protein
VEADGGRQVTDGNGSIALGGGGTEVAEGTGDAGWKNMKEMVSRGTEAGTRV